MRSRTVLATVSANHQPDINYVSSIFAKLRVVDGRQAIICACHTCWVEGLVPAQENLEAMKDRGTPTRSFGVFLVCQSDPEGEY